MLPSCCADSSNTYGERRWLVEVACGWDHEICECLQKGELQQQPSPGPSV